MGTLGQLLAWTVGIASGFAQGTFVYDQQSATESFPGEANANSRFEVQSWTFEVRPEHLTSEHRTSNGTEL